MLRNILNTAIKYFWKNRVYNFINIIGLTVAMSSILIIYLYIANEYKYDKDIENGDKIYRLEATMAVMPSFPGYILKSETGYVENVTRVKIESHNINFNEQAYRLENIGMADSTFFNIFNFRFILGNKGEALKKIHSIVLTKSESEKIFGKTNPINKVILFENKYSFTVTGVIEDPVWFHLPFSGIATIESLREMNYADILEQKDGFDYFTYIVGKPSHTQDETLGSVNAKLLASGYENFVPKFHLTSLDDLYFSKPLSYEGITLHGNKSVLYVLFSIAVLLLSLACINFINLTIARSNIRVKEVGIKKLTGSSKTALVFQFLIESVFIILFALALALILVKVVHPSFCNLIGKQIDSNLIYGPVNAVIILLVTIFIGLLAGLYPAVFMSRTKPILLLKNRSGILSQKSLLSKGLITFQYTISIMLIAGTLVILRQLDFLKEKDLGFTKEQLIYIRLNDDIAKQKSSFKEELLTIPGIVKAAYSGNTMGNEWGNWVNDIEGETRSFKTNSVDPDYFDVMGIKLKEGRTFSREDVNSNFVINETAVKSWELKNPLEVSMLRDGKNYPIIGVVEDFNFQSPRYPILPVLFNFRDDRFRVINIKISTNNINDVLKGIKNIWNKLCPTYVLEYHFIDEYYDRQYKSDTQLGALVGIGGCIAIIIACLGILGLVISSAESKVKEIGIRKVNGAKISEILMMLNMDFIKWVAVAFIIATPVAWVVMHKWLQNFAYKAELSWWIFALAGILALGIALLTVSWQSWRAATRNPIEALRYE